MILVCMVHSSKPLQISPGHLQCVFPDLSWAPKLVPLPTGPFISSWGLGLAADCSFVVYTMQQIYHLT